MTSVRKRHRFRRKLTIAAGVVAALAIVGAIVLWLSLHRVPSWYVPVDVAHAELPAVRNSLPNAYQKLGTGARGRDPFWLELQAGTVTRWIVARAELYPEAATWLPKWIVDPVVAFIDDRAIVAARIKYDGWQAVAAVHLTAQVHNGDIVIRIARLTLGAVPVPITLLDDPLEKLLSDPGLDVEVMPDPIAHVVRRLREVGPEVLVTEGLRWRNLFRVRKGARLVRIKQLSAENGTLRIQLQPRR